MVKLQACPAPEVPVSLCPIKLPLPIVATLRLFVVGLIFLSALGSETLLAAEVLPRYQVGDAAAAEVVTPVPLIVIDAARTEKLRQAEALRVPAIFRYYPDTAGQAEENFRTAFSIAREKFLDDIEAMYGRRQLTTQTLAQVRFQRLLTSLPRRSKTFPLSTNLARRWALGETDEAIQAKWAAPLRDAMALRIRPEALSPAGRLGPQQVRLITVTGPDLKVDVDTVEAQSVALGRSNLVAISKVRKDLQNRFAPEEQAIGKWVAGFVKENCFPDDKLTLESRAKRTDPIWAADHYQAGQVIVRAGERIEARTLAALEQLREQTAAAQAKAQAAEAQAKAKAAVAQFQQQAALAEREARQAVLWHRWLAGGCLVLLAACLLAGWRLVRARRLRGLLPARVLQDAASCTIIANPACAGTELSVSSSEPLPLNSVLSPAAASGPAPTGETTRSSSLEQRALAAERRAERAASLAQAALQPHFARWLKEKFIQRLLTQRTALLSTQRKAEEEVARLERLLAQLHAPLEDRLKAYEKRIVELEHQLAAKGAENRELLKATIRLTRRKLEAERASQGS